MSSDPIRSADRILALSAIAFAVFSYGSASVRGEVSSVPLNAASSAGSGPLFEKLEPTASGVGFAVPIDHEHPMKRLYHPGAACGGLGIGDFDGDGRPDLFFAGGPVGNRLFRQVDDFKFEDATEAAGIDVAGPWGSGTSLADIDNDGDLDIYVCNYNAPNLLYLNQSTAGKLEFSEEAARFGLALVDASQTATFADYDCDGDLDAFVLTNRYIREGGLPEKQPVEIVARKARLLPGFERFYTLNWVTPTRFLIGPVGRKDRLLRNDGGKFVEVSDAAGITEPGEGLSATWWDYNSDGWLDLYVGNDFQDPDHLYKNNLDGTFTDVLDSVVPHTSWYSMGADAADLNNDGLMDFLTADMSATSHFKQKTTMGAMGKFRDFLENARPRQYMRNALYLNSGTGRFMEAAYLAGLADTDWTWSVKLADFDNDGWVDGYFTNGMSRSFNDSDRSQSIEDRIGKTEWDLYEDAPPRLEQNLAFRNRGGLRFEDTSKAWGLDHTGMSLASAYADLDRDGDLDLVTMNFDEPVSIYRNHTAGGRGILVELVGTGSNRKGIGARLELESGVAGKQVRCANPSTGFKSTNGELIHFGLGEQKVAERLWVHWPSGHIQVVEKLQSGRLYTITEPSGPVPPREPIPEPIPMFVHATGLSGALHKETPFDDFKQQPLLPNKLSQLGPGMAWGDADGDGDEDLYLCGAAGMRGQLLINAGDGKFEPSEAWSFDIAEDCEEMGAIFFDADSDGDNDLYVVSGGVEHRLGSDAYRDRLYLNDGNAYFSDAPAALPGTRESGGVVTAADFDRDGDLDLFVGGRVIPGAYPLPGKSRLLVNESKEGRLRFTDATDQLAKGLREVGLVTGAVWSDADGDGWLDLLVTREWGAVVMFANKKQDAGRVLEARELASGSGWWNGIAGRDLDNDGDLDYVLTNFGLNTKYHASPKKPVSIYYGDFDGSGRKRLVEAEFEDDSLFPIRGKSCSSSAIPGLGAKFKTYRGFAAATLEEIYTPETLAGSMRLAADNLQSGVLINDGEANFTFKPLPHLAQIAPSFGVVLSDFDGDGNCDIVLAQNFFSPQLETGRMDGGLGLLLLGDGAANFKPVWPDRSGIVIPGDGKSLTVADLDGDSWPDFVVGINAGAPVAMLNQKSGSGKMLRVLLVAGVGNLNAVGARVTLTRADGEKQSAEVAAGSGYLSQSASGLFFGLGESGGKGARIDVRWPDGSSSTMKEIPPSGGDVVVEFGSP